MRDLCSSNLGSAVEIELSDDGHDVVGAEVKVGDFADAQSSDDRTSVFDVLSRPIRNVVTPRL